MLRSSDFYSFLGFSSENFTGVEVAIFWVSLVGEVRGSLGAIYIFSVLGEPSLRSGF